jgi:fused signal recognition particle receptor
VEIIKGQIGGDAAAVAFDAVQAARARQADRLLIDTAGRLHTKVHLMDELKKNAAGIRSRPTRRSP